MGRLSRNIAYSKAKIRKNDTPPASSVPDISPDVTLLCRPRNATRFNAMPQLFLPFIVVSSSNDTVIQCEMAENREDVFFNFRWGYFDIIQQSRLFGAPV